MTPIETLAMKDLEAKYGPPGVVSRELLAWAFRQYPRVYFGSPMDHMQMRHEAEEEGMRLFPESNWVALAVDNPYHLAWRFGIDMPTPDFEHLHGHHVALTKARLRTPPPDAVMVLAT